MEYLEGIKIIIGMLGTAALLSLISKSGMLINLQKNVSLEETLKNSD